MDQRDHRLDEQALDISNDFNEGSALAVLKPLPFEAETYWHYLDGMDMSEDQKAALLETLWNIMATFVNLGFGDDPVHHIIPALVQAAIDDEDTVTQKTRQPFNTAVGDELRSKHHEQ